MTEASIPKCRPQDDADKAAAAVVPFIGEELEVVRYGLVGADQGRDLARDDFELNAEIELAFRRLGSLWFTWGGSPVAVQDWILCVTRTRNWNPAPQYQEVEVSSLELWRPLIGSKLNAFEILGRRGSPSVARLQFQSASILIGVGTGGWFGGADSIMVRPDRSPFLDFPYDERLDTICSSAALAS